MGKQPASLKGVLPNLKMGWVNKLLLLRSRAKRFQVVVLSLRQVISTYQQVRLLLRFLLKTFRPCLAELFRQATVVDVYATGVETACLGQDILVLATNASSTSDTQSKASISWVTIAVDPDKVQEYVAASQELQIYFVLPADVEASSAEDSPSADQESAG